LSIIKNWTRRATATPKIVYLLEHQYTPASLSFAGLKNADAALGQVLTLAAQQAGCAVHLGIVHIEESGAAELQYDPYNDRYGYGYDYDDDEAAFSDPDWWRAERAQPVDATLVVTLFEALRELTEGR
jgi:hypothetical protein